MTRRLRLCFSAAALAILSTHAHTEPVPGARMAAGWDPWYIGYWGELNWNASLAQLNASWAYARGLSGAGQTVAVFDSGIDYASNQFSGRIAGPGYDAISDTVGPVPEGQWHGSFVSGIIAANRDGIGMMGIAYNASILPIRIVDETGEIGLSDYRLAKAVFFGTAAGARIFNNSWNAAPPIQAFSVEQLNAALPATIGSWRQAVAAGAVVVFAAGNEGASEPGLYAGLPVYYPEFRAGWLAAVATDEAGMIAAYSNRCGATAAWCLAAPGTNIISVYDGGYGMASGTSFAAANLSGAVAILKQLFPYLSNAQILTILFQTANKSGVYADSATYGQGLLDLERATRPIGPLMVSAISGSLLPLGASSLYFSAAFGHGFLYALADRPIVAQDDFGRGYAVSLSHVVGTGASLFEPETAFDAFGGDMRVVRRGGMVLSYRYGTNASGELVPERFLIEQDAGKAFAAAGYHVDPSWALTARSGGAIARGDLVFGSATAVPYLSIAERAVSVAYGNRLGRYGTLRIGAFSGEARSAPAEAADYVLPEGARETASVSGIAAAFEMAPREGLALGLDAGVVVERATLLGAMSSGATAFGENSPTYYAGLRGRVQLRRDMALEGAAHLGLTEPSVSAESVIQSASGIVTTSFHLALVKEDIGPHGGRAGIVVSQPMRVVSGTANLRIPTQIDPAGHLLYTPFDASLKADGRELDIQGFYAVPLRDGERLNLGAMLRIEPDNVADAAPAAVVMARYQLSF